MNTDEMPALPAPEPTTSAIEQLFETLLADIVRGTYPAGSRLPAERELSRILGASRPTLREALRRLGEWNMVSARRGSGIVVREVRDWTIEVLPAYMRYAPTVRDHAALSQFVSDLLHLRRSVMLDVVRMVAGRLPPGGTDEALAAAKRAWAARTDGVEFVTHDFMVIRSLVEAANFLPAVWTINRIAFVYLDLARTLSAAVTPPDDYLEAYQSFLAKLAVDDSATAVAELETYLLRHDHRMMTFLTLAT
jgi:GntR family transcriptional repressor for pyruvate dehydrogenase complex